MYEKYEINQCSMYELENNDLDSFQKNEEIIFIRFFGNCIAVEDIEHGWWKITDIEDPNEFLYKRDMVASFCRINESIWVNSRMVHSVNEKYIAIEERVIPIDFMYCDCSNQKELKQLLNYCEELYITEMQSRHAY